MSIQLPLPAGWARQFASMPDPRDRLDALAHAKLSARAEIRKVLQAMIDEFGVRPREIDRAMDHVDDTISDLVWEVENGYRHEIEDGHPLWQTLLGNAVAEGSFPASLLPSHASVGGA